MGKDLDILQAVKDNDQVGLQKLLQKVSKQTKNKLIGSNKKLNVNFQDADGMSALHQAALMSSAQMLLTLLDSGASPGLRDNKGMIALHYATWQGIPQPVQILLKGGSPVNEQALSGETPLHLAAQHGHYDVTVLLLNHHADPTICNKDLRTAVDLACEFGRSRVVELLLRSNLCQKLLEDSPTDTLDNNRTTCLHLAARNGHVEVVKLLLQTGMNINRCTLKGTCLHEAAMAGKTEVIRLLLDCGIDVNKPNSYDQTALDIVQKFANGQAGKELKNLLKEASCALYARAIKDYSNVYDPGSLTFREGDIITVLEQRTDGIWRGYVYHEGRMAKTGMFPANNVVLVDSKVVRQQQQQQQQQQQHKPVQMYGQVPDLLNRGPSGSTGSAGQHYYSASDRGSMESSNTDDSQPVTPHSFPSTPSSHFPPPPSSMLASYHQKSPLIRDFSGADSGFSSSQSLPQHTPSSPATPQQFGKPVFAFGPTVSASGGGPDSQPHHHRHHHLQHNGEWPPAPTSLPALGGIGGDMRGSSPAKDSPGHSNRNSAASSDSGRGFSTGHSDVKSYESGVSCRQSYHSTSSSSLGSLDRLEEPGCSSTINVAQLLQAGVPDNEVLHAWLHDLHFEEYYTLFTQAGYDMPTISRMTPEDLTAIGITKPAHRKRLKSEIARLNIHDGIPDFRPNDLMEWLHLLGLGVYLDTLCGQGYDNIDCVTDITWEDLEEIGIQKLGHQKKIMLAIDRLKRITSGVKRQTSTDGRTASLELLEPPPPAPPMTGRWSGGEITAVSPYVYDRAGGGARPKRSPSGDSLSTASGANSTSSISSGSYNILGCSPAAGGEVRTVSLPREDVGLAGAVPYRHNSTGSASGILQPDLVAIQMKKIMKSSASEDSRDGHERQLMYQSCHGSDRWSSDNEVFVDTVSSSEIESNSIYAVASAIVTDKQRPIARVMANFQTEKHEHEVNTDGNKLTSNTYVYKANTNSAAFSKEMGEHIYDLPQIFPSHKSSKPSVMVKPAGVFDSEESGLLTPGSKAQKKIPPPPPKRTDSIRGDTTSNSIPNSPNKTPTAPTTITIAASVHPQPTVLSVTKQPPPPVTQKPMSPAVINKLQQQNGQHYHQLNPTIVQKLESPKPVQLQKVLALTSSNHPSLQTPALEQGIQQQKVFLKPIVQQPQVHPKSPLPQKSSNTPNVSSIFQQQQKPHFESLTHNPHMEVEFQSQTSNSQPKSQAIVLPSQHPQPNSASVQPQVQAFASCMKSLSEKFGKNTQEDDQFPDNVSTDSDDFPPPPPPIAMDILTPKIHNYGIPSPRDRGKPEYGLHHQREYAQKSQSTPSAVKTLGPVTGQPETSQKTLNWTPGQHVQAAEVIAPMKKLPEHLAGIKLTKQPQVLSSNSSPSSSDHEHTPEPESMATVRKESCSQSTKSMQSSISSCSVDSNTLPFANENVGTIKQRAVNAKPSIVNSVNLEDGHKSVDLNPNMFGNESHKFSYGYQHSSASLLSQTSYPHHISAAAGQSTNSSAHSSDTQFQKQQHELPSSSDSAVPPLPGKKPVFGAKTSQPSAEPLSLQSTSAQQLNPQLISTGDKSESGNVLSDIDVMLQGLTDELDAMLEDEMTS
ncbi:hypothetical protein BsWGS_05792 [Bradybaena similaris]